MMNIELIGSKEEFFDNYYMIRCEASDIYWMGHKTCPDYNMIKKCYLNRLESSKFVDVGDKKILLISNSYNDEKNIIGHIQLSINEDGVEIGISVIEKFHGKGVATKAIKLATVEALKYSDILYAQIRDDNYASQNAFIKNNYFRTNEYVENEYPMVGIVKLRKYIFEKIRYND